MEIVDEITETSSPEIVQRQTRSLRKVVERRLILFFVTYSRCLSLDHSVKIVHPFTKGFTKDVTVKNFFYTMGQEGVSHIF